MRKAKDTFVQSAENTTLNPKIWEYSKKVREPAIKNYYAGTSVQGVGKIFGFNANVYKWIKKTEKK